MKTALKHAIPFLLAICLLVTLCCASAAGILEKSSKELPFTDSSKNDWFYPYVYSVYTFDLMKGVNDTTFAPHITMSRAMLVTVLYRMVGLAEAHTSENYPFAGFVDVPANAWYAEAVDWAVDSEIVKGIDATHFVPDSPVSREQTVTLFFRLTNAYAWQPKNGGQILLDNGQRASLYAYPDANRVHSYAAEPFQWAVANGILTGTTSDAGVILAPSGSTTRAQAAAIMVRFAHYIDSVINASPA